MSEQDWSAQAQSMMNAWAEAQRSAWRAWADLATPPAGAGAAERGSGGGPGGPGAAPDMGALSETWRRMADQTTQAWTAGADPVARDVASRIVDSQQTAMRFAGMMMQGWQDMAGLGTDGNDWAKALERFGEQLRGAAWRGPSSFGDSGSDMAEMWKLYLESISRMAGPWAETMTRSPGHFGEAVTGNHSELLELSRLYWDAWERTGGRLFEGPSLGFTREFEEDLLRGFDAWVDWRKSIFEYQTVYGRAYSDAVESFMAALHARAEAGEPLESMGELFVLWTQETDDVLEAAFRTEEYAVAQGKMLKDAMIYRQHEREIVETFLKMTDIPARSELDEAFKAIHNLRREVRALRRDLEAERAKPAASVKVTAATAAARKPAAKKPAARKPAAKKAPAKKAATRKPAAKKAPPKKATSTSATKPRKAKGGDA